MTLLLFLIFFCSTIFLKADDIPEYYKIQADDINFYQTTMDVGGKYIPAVTMGVDSIELKRAPWQKQISDADKKRGFVIERIGVSQNLTADDYLPKPHPETRLNMVLTKGEFRSAVFALHNLTREKSFYFKFSDMVSNNGDIISKENFDVRYVRYVTVHSSVTSSYRQGRYLIKKNSLKIPENNTSWLWLTLHAPRKVKSGIYRGQLLVKDDKKGEIILPVALRIVDIDFKYPKGNWGMYMPGHLNRRSCGIYRNYSPPWWKEKNLKTIFDFWKTRGLNSPNLYLPYPNLSYSDNSVEASFKELNKIVTAARKSCLDGTICIDVRPIEFWAHAVKVLKEKKTKIVGYHGTHTRVTGKPYEDTDKEVFGSAIKKLMKSSQKYNWGKILLLPEEELCSTRWVDKPAGYEAFAPVLIKTAGRDKVMLVDNCVGYPAYNNDTGARDKIMTRQYNSWTQQALEAAKKDKAAIWAFNFGFSRQSWGLLAQRLGATGNHQWAEAWEFYQFAIPVNNKIIPSIQYERMREGLCDLAMFRKLQQLIPKVNNPKLCREAEVLLKEIIKKIPCRRYPYLKWEKTINDEQMDIIRWETIKKILKLKAAIHNKKYFISKTEKPQQCRILGQWNTPEKIEKDASRNFQEKLKDKKAVALWLDKKIIIDGKFDPSWAKTMKTGGKLYWTAEREAYLRRAASSESDFKRFGPLWNEWRAAYDANGLYLLFQSNLGKGIKAIRKDDAPDIWRDDCIEIFWRPSRNMSVRQLLVSLNGAKTLMLNGRSVKNQIKTAVKLRQKNGSGCFIEIFIPWKDSGISTLPPSETSWDFNFAMEYHSGRQMLIWSQVKRRFGLSKGKLMFSPPEKNGVKVLNFNPGNLFYGTNQLILNLVSKSRLKAELFNAQGEMQWSDSINDGCFVRNYTVPDLDKSEKWILKIKNLNDETILSLPIILPANKCERLKFIKAPERAFSNSNIVIEFESKVGEVSAKTLPLNIRFVNLSNKQIYSFKTQKLMMAGRQFLQIGIGNIPAGKYSLQISIDNFKSVTEKKIDIYQNFL